MDPEKVDAIQSWSPPTTVYVVQVFLGFANFYRRFIRSKITTPLTRLVQKGSPFAWGPTEQQSFKGLKSLFTSAPILQHFLPSLPVIFETDASDFAIAGILPYPDPEKRFRPVVYFSRKLQPAESNCEIYDKEMFGIVEAFRQCRPYLEGATNMWSTTTTNISNT